MDLLNWSWFNNFQQEPEIKKARAEYQRGSSLEKKHNHKTKDSSVATFEDAKSWTEKCIKVLNDLDSSKQGLENSNLSPRQFFSKQRVRVMREFWWG